MQVCVSFQCEQTIVHIPINIHVLLYTVHIVLVLVPDCNLSFSSFFSLSVFLSSRISVFVIITDLCEKLKYSTN